MTHLREAHHLLVVTDPLVHLPKLDVSHNMVDSADTESTQGFVELLKAGKEHTRVFGSADQGMDRLTVGRDLSLDDLAVLVLEHIRFHHAACPSLHGHAVGLFGV